MIVVVGSVNYDFVFNVPHHPESGETVRCQRYMTHRGGKGGNQAVAAARAGATVRFVGCVGRDSFGSDLEKGLRDNQVDTRYLSVVEEPTGLAAISVDTKGENRLIGAYGANHSLTPSYLTADMFTGADVVLMQLEIPFETAQRAAELARDAGALTVLNYSPTVEESQFDFSTLDYLLVNETEAAFLLGCKVADVSSDPVAAVQRLRDYGPAVVLTLGARGCAWSTGHGSSDSLAAPEVKSVDATGAGDAFAGTFAAQLMRRTGIEDAVRFSTHAGALAVTKAGAQPSLPYYQQIIASMGEFSK